MQIRGKCTLFYSEFHQELVSSVEKLISLTSKAVVSLVHWFNTPASTCTWRRCIPDDLLGSVFYSLALSRTYWDIMYNQKSPTSSLIQVGFSSPHWLICSFVEIGTAHLLMCFLGLSASQILPRLPGQDCIIPAFLPQLTRPGMGTWINRTNYILSQQFGL